MKKAEINILVVDDDANSRNALSEAVKRFGYRPTATAKADEALNLVKIKPFHAAIVDCMLPKMNGVELAKSMRKSRFGDAPLVLVSGVFKDKGFASESIEATQALGFLNKPLDIQTLKNMLDQHFSELTSPQKIPLHVLVSKPFSSARERTKVIEGLEEVKGLDLPFVLCVLMEAQASGHMNVINGLEELYGISLQNGLIAKVDSSESDEALSNLLLTRGLVMPDDLSALKEGGRRGDLISQLLDQHLISPHMVSPIRKELTIKELRRLFVSDLVKINFVPDRKKGEAEGLNLDDLTPLLHDVVEKLVTPDYLEGFYREWVEYPIQVGPAFSSEHPIFKMPLLAQLNGLADLLNKNLTMEEIWTKGGWSAHNFFRALHLLAFRRLIIFDDVKKVKGVSEYGEKIKTLIKDLQGKNPFQVFEYFGCGKEPKETDVDRVYREFARSNHPDLLPPSAPVETRENVNRVFSIVSEAHAVLMNADKRAKLQNDLKQHEAERQIRAENLSDEAVTFLRRGKASEALMKTKEAIQLYDGRNVKIAHAWALLKTDPEKSVSEVNRLLESIPHEERRISQYQFVSALLKAAVGDRAGALALLDKVMVSDPSFVEARREKANVEASTPKVDIFNADLTQLVGSFFKKKN